MSAVLRLNPKLDLSPYIAAFRERGIVQIPNIFEDETANAIASVLQAQTPWRLLMTNEHDEPLHFTRDEWNALPDEARTARLKDVMKRASQNRGFYYYTYPMIEAYMRGWDKGTPLHQMTELINGPDFLNLGRQITGVSGIVKADAHACEYRPGHYLTRHIDYGADFERRAAYVLGFTRGWQPDWGGLLLFLKENQDIDHGFLPRFNNLTIFDINYLHTVTQVSTFAGAPRHTITGWFRDDPPAKASK